MPKVAKKVTKVTRKSTVVTGVKSTKSESNQMLVSALVVVSAVIFGPAAWYIFQSVVLLFVIPAAASIMAALMFKQITGTVMTDEFRKETTTVTAVFAVILAVLSALNLPQIGLDGKADTVLPIFMIIYMSVWAIVGVLVTVYLPLGLTIPKKK